ncbi:CrcB family protein [Conexibacter sp. CPCC 206217]|uniref:CrcB family protein n=1 Tax=Conexibacter sp. CPCC 206217 TaxID=3064574 RepID=UPI0027222119|nr:CrcB family protein [Conexibacter sp. CPCC 206217]MDO8213756.1 hypothetical protein [Conexibacter sp. CPCC 206217]
MSGALTWIGVPLLGGIALRGGYTTFSTWMVDSERLRATGHAQVAALNVAGSLAAGLAALAL